MNIIEFHVTIDLLWQKGTHCSYYRRCLTTVSQTFVAKASSKVHVKFDGEGWWTACIILLEKYIRQLESFFKFKVLLSNQRLRWFSYICSKWIINRYEADRRRDFRDILFLWFQLSFKDSFDKRIGKINITRNKCEFGDNSYIAYLFTQPLLWIGERDNRPLAFTFEEWEFYFPETGFHNEHVKFPGFITYFSIVCP